MNALQRLVLAVKDWNKKEPDDTVVADIIEYGNFNEYGGELGEDDWIASYTTAPPD